MTRLPWSRPEPSLSAPSASGTPSSLSLVAIAASPAAVVPSFAALQPISLVSSSAVRLSLDESIDAHDVVQRRRRIVATSVASGGTVAGARCDRLARRVLQGGRSARQRRTRRVVDRRLPCRGPGAERRRSPSGRSSGRPRRPCDSCPPGGQRTAAVSYRESSPRTPPGSRRTPLATMASANDSRLVTTSPLRLGCD